MDVPRTSPRLLHSLRRTALRRGFLVVGPLVTAAYRGVEFVSFNRYDGPHPGWYILYPLVYVVSSTVASLLTRTPDAAPGVGIASTRSIASGWARPLVGGALAGLAVSVLAMPSTRHSLYAPTPARYVFDVVDSSGDPVQGARVRLIEASQRDGPLATSRELGLGLHVLDEMPITDAKGRLVVEQPLGAASGCRTEHTLFGIVVAQGGKRGSRTLSIEREGYRAATISLDEFDRAHARHRKHVEVGTNGDELYRWELRVVLAPLMQDG